MKKLLLSTAILLGSLSTFAQTNTTTKIAQTETTTKIEATAKTELPSKKVQDNYTQIKLEEVPTEVKVSIIKSFPTSIIEKAYVNDKKEYKLEVKTGRKSSTVFADATGRWIK